ncbi:hypothetical protein Glove_547g46 [Diversispora epigaea]|uniref:Uncharacterized protein n=1 Tax=Diversispora epigaea TaxID=1348612 RepID=A0A397GDK2_9GLOM|nr:hypothetical protein Glove_547g46 [Diversispora epigaea]
MHKLLVFGIWDLGFRQKILIIIWDLGFGISAFGFRIWAAGITVLGQVGIGKFHETDEDLVFIPQGVNTKSFEEIQNGGKSESFVAVVGQTVTSV